MGKARTLSLAAAALALTLSGSLFAGDAPLSPILSMSIARNGNVEWQDQSTMLDLGAGTYGATEAWDANADPNWGFGYALAYASGQTSGSGPVIVRLAFGLTNNTGFDDSFTVNASLPLLTSLGSGWTMGGSIEGAVADSDFDGSTSLSDSGVPVYSGLVDGSTRLTLLNDPFSIAPGGTGEQSTFGPDSAGLPGVSLPGIGATPTNDIGLSITFDLSAGDSAIFTADFVILPAPGALALLGMGLIAPRRRRRR